MALTLQRTLELGGALSKVQPQLQRLHIVKKPKKRHLLRNVALVGSTLAVGAVVAVVVLRSRSCRTKAVAGDGQGTQARGQETPEAEPEWEGLATDVDAPHDIAIPVPA